MFRERRVVTIQLGYFINPEYPSSYSVSRAIREQRELVSTVAELGMTSVFVGEHYSHGDFAWLPPLLLLGSIHDAAPGLTYGTAVLSAALHNPVVLAEHAAYLNAAMDGKFVLGLAAGWNPREFAALDVPLAGRGARLESSIRLMRALWSGESVSVGQPEIDVQLGLRAPREGGPEIWLGGSSKRALDRAARMADGWIMSSHVPAEVALRQVSEYQSRLEVNGRALPSVRPALRNIFVATSHDRAVNLCAPYLTASYRMFESWGLFTEVLNDNRPELDYQRASERAIIGSIDEVAEELVSFIRASGVNMLLARSQWVGIPHVDVARSMELLSMEVMPIVRRELAASG